MLEEEERKGEEAGQGGEGLSELLPGRTEPFVFTSAGTAFGKTAKAIQITLIWPTH